MPGSALSDWKFVSLAMPRDGTMLRLLCQGSAPHFLPFICTGRFNGTGWAAYEGDTCVGMVEPLRWQFIQ